ncbi:Mg(2+) transport ATPase protein C [Alkalibacterium sp. AK22]|uniref:MgtC/SapB family protein n=1 Tax=Alkalibacterium sp. AK22 TaxID=1229520 RepID=UPI00044744FB|nr:MgtC/SapB family protein [Alkalibacterium sp. AK22]EXJ22975.1 Mg(2+) transport ATPase protein C [Alkalibacterium sp. AK22]
MELMEFATRIIGALLLGMTIGIERQWRQRMAGLRTNALVAVGASLYVTLSMLVETDSSPTRIAAAVVSGIGFLGAGVIMRQGMNIQGLNTAATLWCSAAIGVLSGGGYIMQAAIGTAVILNTNILLRSIQGKISDYKIHHEAVELPYKLSLTCSQEDESHIRSLLLSMVGNGPMALTSLSSEDNRISSKKIEVNARLLVNQGERQLLEQVVGRLSLESSVSAISWEVSI